MGSKVVELCHSHGLSIHNNGRYTRIKNGTISAPDLTVSRGLPSNCSWQVDHYINFNSDHCPTVFPIHEPKEAMKTRWDLGNTDWDLWKIESDSCFSPFCADNTNQPFANICRNVSYTLIKCAQTNIPTKTICDHSKSFMNPHLKTLLHKAKEAQKIYNLKGDPHNFQNYNKAVEGFIQAYHVTREENLKDLYSKLDPAELRTQNSEIVYLTFNLQIHAIHKLNN